MEKIDWLRTLLLSMVTVMLSIGGVVAGYYRTVHLLELKFRDKIEEQLKQMTDLKVEIEKLKSKDELQQQIIDQLKKHVLDNLPALYKALEEKGKK
jgi:proteasome assembly chaperone (PAC2) family protein